MITEKTEMTRGRWRERSARDAGRSIERKREGGKKRREKEECCQDEM